MAGSYRLDGALWERRGLARPGAAAYYRRIYLAFGLQTKSILIDAKSSVVNCCVHFQIVVVHRRVSRNMRIDNFLACDNFRAEFQYRGSTLHF